MLDLFKKIELDGAISVSTKEKVITEQSSTFKLAAEHHFAIVVSFDSPSNDQHPFSKVKTRSLRQIAFCNHTDFEPDSCLHVCTDFVHLLMHSLYKHSRSTGSW